MPVVGAVLVLSNDDIDREVALLVLAADPRVTAGELAWDRLPLAVATDSPEEDEHFWKDVLALHGVVHADIVFAANEAALEESPDTTS